MIDLSGKVALVTGGNHGIGRAISLALAEAGAKVVFFYLRDDKSADEVTGKLGLKYGIVGLKCDVRDVGRVAVFLRDISQMFGKLSVLVNNAGVNFTNELDKVTEPEWSGVMSTNLYAPFAVIQTAISHLNDGASIVNVSSVSAALGGPVSVHYAASKAGLEALTRGAAKFLAHRNIRVNAVAPGYMESPMTSEGVRRPRVQAEIDRIPLARLGTAEDVAGVALWLASDLSRYVTGQVIRVDGGLVM